MHVPGLSGESLSTVETLFPLWRTNMVLPFVQGCMSDSSQPGMASHSGATGMYRGGAQKQQGDVSMAGVSGGQSSVDAIYRAVVDAAGKGMQVTITAGVSGSTQASPVPALSAMSAFTASIGQPLSLPHAVNAVIHAPRSSDGTDLISQPHRARPQLSKRTRRSSEQGKNTPDGGDTHEYFRSPSAATPMRLHWDEPNQPHWRGEEFLECSTQVHTGSCSSKVERASIMETVGLTRDPVDPQTGESGNLRLNNCIAGSARERGEPVERCTQLNGTLHRAAYGEPLTGDDQSPGSSTSLEGPLVKDYTHFNGHFNGHCAPSPSDTKSLSSEEELRHPDSPSADLLHYRPRAFNVGELVWPIKGFPAWPNKLMGEEQHNPSMQLSEQAKVSTTTTNLFTLVIRTVCLVHHFSCKWNGSPQKKKSLIIYSASCVIYMVLFYVKSWLCNAIQLIRLQHIWDYLKITFLPRKQSHIRLGWHKAPDAPRSFYTAKNADCGHLECIFSVMSLWLF